MSGPSTPGGSSRRPPRRPSRLAGEHPAYPTPDGAADPETPTTPDAPMPPPRMRRATREQLNTRVTVEMYQRLHAFVSLHDAAVQDVVEGALDEYLTRRGG